MIDVWCKDTAFLSIITIHKISQNVQNCRFFSAGVLRTKKAIAIPFAVKRNRFIIHIIFILLPRITRW